MKLKYILSLLVVSLLFTACRKEKPGPFAGTDYQTLGKYDNSGLPSYLLPKDNISSALQSFMDGYLVNGRNLISAHPELFTNSAIADIKVTKPSTIYMTFVHQEAWQNNALAFYSYPTDNPPASAKDIERITYAFPNVGESTPLKPGDKVSLGQFNPGTSVGFVLLISGWDKKAKSLNNKSVHYCTNYVLNPEKDPGLRKHAVLIEYPAEKKVMIGFEDMNREDPNCDDDFNDVVFYCTVVN